VTINIEEFLAQAVEAGFDHVGELDVKTIELLPEVRNACETGRCPAYNKNWSCPPALGTLEECDKMIKAYKRGAILQTTGEIEDDYDFEGMMEGGKKARKVLDDILNEMRKNGETFMALGCEGCHLCEKCTYPHSPCRFPEKAIPSVEACGINVVELAKNTGIKYNNGANTVTYFCVILF